METNNIQNTMSVSAFIECKGPVLLTDEHKSYAKKDREDDQSFGVGVIFIPSKNPQNCRKFAETTWKRTNTCSISEMLNR